MNAKAAVQVALYLLKVSQNAIHRVGGGKEGEAYLGLGKAIAIIESVQTLANSDLEQANVNI